MNQWWLLTNSLGVIGSVRFEMRQDVESERSIQQLELTYNNSITLEGKVRTSHGPFLHFTRKRRQTVYVEKGNNLSLGRKIDQRNLFLTYITFGRLVESARRVSSI